VNAVTDVLGGRVDLVGNARGQLTDRLELARVSELDLQLLLLREIPDRPLKKLLSPPIHSGKKHGGGKLLAVQPFVGPFEIGGAFLHRRLDKLFGCVGGGSSV
jgi:hypothetical protein